jgi:hypothetical protein
LNKGDCALSKSAARLYQRFPTTRRNFFQKQKLEFPVIGKMSRWQNARVIQNEQIVIAQEFFEINEMGMFDFLLVAMQHHHSGSFPTRQWMLRDQFPRQFVVVIFQPRTHSRFLVPTFSRS